MIYLNLTNNPTLNVVLSTAAFVFSALLMAMLIINHIQKSARWRVDREIKRQKDQ